MSAPARLFPSISRWISGAVVLMQLTACVSSPPPREFDLSKMQLVVASAPPRLDVSGLPGGKSMGAGVGVGTGTGAGALLGAAACVAAGPLIALCLAAVLPATTIVGAVTGGVVGAVKTESVEELQRKTRAIRDELAVNAYPVLLAEQLQQELRSARGVAVPLARGTTSGEASSQNPDVGPLPWTLDVAVTEIGTEGKKEFALRLVTRIALRHEGRPDPVWTIEKEVQSETELTTSAWLLAGAGAMRIVLERCVLQAAHELAVDLTRPQAGPGAANHPRSRSSTSCQDVPDDVIKAATVAAQP